MTRLITAVLIIAALLAVLALPPLAFGIAAALVLVLAWHEYAGLCAHLEIGLAAAPGALLAIACALALGWRSDAALAVLIASFLLLVMATLRDHRDDPRALATAAAAGAAGLAWLALPMGAQMAVRQAPHGVTWLLLLYASVAVGDSAAYYGGTAWGRHRLAPALSPKKSVEGSVFGLAGSAAAGAVVSHWLPELSYGAGAVLGASLGLVGQAGDLLESALKRSAGQKDSSALLPGHGGILDRIDAHLPASLLLWLVLSFR